MTKPELSTSEEVIDALGGLDAVMTLTGAGYKRTSNWKAFGVFPSKFYVVMTEALRDSGKRAPASLWKMAEPVSDAARGKAA